MVLAARALLGASLVRVDADGVRIGRIVEVEAYGGEDDAASHARFGRTGRNAAMYGPPGRAYVYRVYGMHRCLNVVTGPAGEPSAVLVRAVEAVASIETMRSARFAAATAGRRSGDPARVLAERHRIDSMDPWALASGPALVAAAFSVGMEDGGADLCDVASPLRLGAPPDRASRDGADRDEPVVAAGPRVGIGYAAPPWDTLPWRFWLPESDAVSRPRRAPAADR